MGRRHHQLSSGLAHAPLYALNHCSLPCAPPHTLRLLQLTAHMNAAYQAKSGLPPDLFPSELPVYMGHYHYPQSVPGTRITYIGSPYQGPLAGSWANPYQIVLR